jgi:hypothetical protein
MEFVSATCANGQFNPGDCSAPSSAPARGAGLISRR